MTRLKTSDIVHIPEHLAAYDAGLKTATGLSLWEIGCRTAGIDAAGACTCLRDLSVAVIPTSAGQGVIPGFGEAVVQIVRHAGGRAWMTAAPDVGGLAEAFNRSADILMLADDRCFVAVHVCSKTVVDNGIATGAAYAAALDAAAGGVAGRRVLVLGCGPVGAGAVGKLTRIGARVTVYDIRGRAAAGRLHDADPDGAAGIVMADSLESALAGHRLIVDATPAAGIITADTVFADTHVAAPGVPCGLDAAARAKIAGRLIHDTLEIGVAAMLAMAVGHHMEMLGNQPTPAGADQP